MKILIFGLIGLIVFLLGMFSGAFLTLIGIVSDDEFRGKINCLIEKCSNF